MLEALGKITANYDVIYPRYDPALFVGREWLVREVEQLRDSPDGRQLIIVGKPGSGKSAFVAYLAEAWNCPRHFIRVDSIGGVTGISPRNFLVSIGEQLYQKYGPTIFASEESQRTKLTVGMATDRAEVVGRFIDELYTLPFLPQPQRDIQVRVGVAAGQSRVIGEQVRKLFDVTLALDESTLLHVAVIHPLQEIKRLYPQETVVILVDALDESLQHPGIPIVDIIPSASDGAYPSNLRLVMTSRNGDYLVKFRAQDLLYLDNREKGYWQENRKDTRTYILKQLITLPLAEIIGNWSEKERDAYITRVQANSDGNFLFLYHFFHELFDAVSNGETDLKKILVPKGIDEIYRYFAVAKIRDRISDSIQFTALSQISEALISQCEKLPGVRRVQIAGQQITLDVENINLVLGPLLALSVVSSGQITNPLIYPGAGGDAWETKYLPILGILSVAYEALSREQLAEFAGVALVFVDRVLAHIEQFLDEVSNERQNRYRIYHISFSEYLLDSSRNREYPLDGRFFHDKITDYYLNGYSQWENVNWRLVAEDYTYQYLPLHLLAANREEEFYSLINKGWMQAKLVHSHSNNSFSEDIMRAIQVAEHKEPINFTQIIRLSLIQATLRSIANAVPAGLIGSLAFINSSSAMAMAEGNAALIIKKERQANAYQIIGEAFLKRKNIDVAEVNLIKAIKTAKEIPNIYDQANFIESLSRTVIKLNNKNHLQELLNVVSIMSNEYLKASSLASIARMLADAGEQEDGLDVVERARLLTESFSDDSSSYRPYAKIAVALDHLKDKKKAEEVANLAIASARSNPEFLNDVTNLLLDMTDPQKAMEAANQALLVLDTFPNSMTKLECMSVLAKNLARIDDAQRAISSAEWVLDTVRVNYRKILAGYESYALGNIAQAFAILDEKTRALEIANMALVASNQIGRSDPKLEALLDIIPVAVTTQNQPLLTQVLQSVGKFIGSPRWEISEVEETFEAICSAMVELGDHDGLKRSLQIANEIKDNWRRIAACGCVVQHMIKLGDEKDAMEIADRIFADAQQLFGNEADKKRCQGAIVMIYAQHCPPEILPSLQNAIENLNTAYKTATLATIALRLAQQDDEKQVHDAPVSLAAGHQNDAQLKLLSGLALAREWSRNKVFSVVEENTETLAAIDQGETLWKIFEVVQEVDNWWKMK